MKVVFLATLLFITACNANKVKKFDLYTSTIVDKVEPFPTKEELQERLKVVIAVDDKTNVNVANFNQQQSALAGLEGLLEDIKTVDVLDRNIIKSIKEEMILSELKKGVKLDLNKDADYVFLVQMDSLIFSSEYDARTFAKVAFSAAKMAAVVGAAVASDGRGIYIDASENAISGKYDYKVTFSGSILIINLASGQQITKIPITSIIEDSESAQNSGLSRPKEVDSAMMNRAIVNAIENATDKIVAFVPAVGHVMQRSDYKEDEPALFRATFGSKDGLKPGDTVILERKKYELNQLTNAKEISALSLPIGSIIENDYQENFCWIKVEDKVLASTIKIGEKVISYVKPDLKK